MKYTHCARGLDTRAHGQFRGELSRQQAVQAAILSHPSVRAEYARLDIAAADVVRASELLNPSLSLSWLDASGGDDELGTRFAAAGNMTPLQRAELARGAAEARLALLDAGQQRDRARILLEQQLALQQ